MKANVPPVSTSTQCPLLSAHTDFAQDTDKSSYPQNLNMCKADFEAIKHDLEAA